MGFKWLGMSADGEKVVLNKFTGSFNQSDYAPDYATDSWLALNADLIRNGIIIDVETSGLKFNEDKIIEIALRSFRFNRSNGDIVRIDECYSALQDPGFALSEEIQRLTGLNDDMLRGQSINWDIVDNIFTKAQIIIAHNANFDRPFVDRCSKISPSKIWGCSYKQIDWSKKGYTSSKLEALSIYHGFFTDAHRALNDVNALLHLLSMQNRNTGKIYFYELVNNAKLPMTHVFAANSPFDKKELLKEKGYKWDTFRKIWHKVILKDELTEETAWLAKAIYQGKFTGTAEDIPLNDSFKAS